MKTTYRMLAITLAMMLGMSLGCDSEDNKSYDVQIEWLIGGQSFCDDSFNVQGERIDLDISEIKISVFGDERDTEHIFSDRFECADNDNIYTIPELKKGKYWVEVEAYAIWEGEERAYLQIGKLISAPSGSTPIPMPLEIGTADVEVNWRFEDGFPCGANGVETVKLTFGSEEYVTSCSDGLYTVEDLTWGDYAVGVVGISDSGATTRRGDYDADLETEEIDALSVRPGETYEISLLLKEI